MFVQRIARAAGLAFEISTLLDGQSLMVDVTFDVARRLEQNALAANRAHDLAADNDFLSTDRAGDIGTFADDDVGASNVALDFSLNLDFAFGDKVAGDGEIRAN